MKKNIMLDLETMGSGSNAAIVAIGAVIFDPSKALLGSHFYTPVSLSSSIHYGDVDSSTIEWWLKQSDQARAVFFVDDKKTLKDALQAFRDWLDNEIPEFKDRVVWGNGATFDNVILGNAYKAIRQKQPWPYFGDRDVRTIVDMGRQIKGIDPKKDIQLSGTAHNALDDAKHQAEYVSAIYSCFEK